MPLISKSGGGTSFPSSYARVTVMFYKDKVCKAPVTLSRFDCYVLLRFKMLRFMSFFDGLYVYTTLFYVFLRTVTFCHGLLEMQSLRSATLHYVLLRMYNYVLLRFATYWYGLVRFNYVPLRLRYVLIRLCYVLVRPTT
jgi:hypothetical protein